VSTVRVARGRGLTTATGNATVRVARGRGRAVATSLPVTAPAELDAFARGVISIDAGGVITGVTLTVITGTSVTFLPVGTDDFGAGRVVREFETPPSGVDMVVRCTVNTPTGDRTADVPITVWPPVRFWATPAGEWEPLAQFYL
jgi:hypothetical protein